jgi:phage-related minor tail protein
MEEAVAQAKDALVHMKPPPSSLEPIQGAVDTSVAVVANIKSLSTTWGPLLDKVKLFTELVDGIAQVSG